MTSEWTITPEQHDPPLARTLWRTYYTEVSDRWYLLYEGRHSPYSQHWFGKRLGEQAE
ncbi:hypothetical protein [Nocardia sp. NPDC051570]|uniref:hypothetical protein n=1 Tax=Nocardia sp. NPDC051570 TaxID=3364324 RepID=UPI00379D2D15